MNATVTRKAAAIGQLHQFAIVKMKVHQLAERGMATAEYAVGILAAVALALVLLKVFNADSFLTTITKLISTIFTKLIDWIP